MISFYVLDLPSGETQHKGARVGRALWTPPPVLPAREPGLSYCCPEGNVTDLSRTLLHRLLHQTRRHRKLEKTGWNIAFWCLPHVHTRTHTDTFLRANLVPYRKWKSSDLITWKLKTEIKANVWGMTLYHGCSFGGGAETETNVLLQHQIFTF